MYHIIYYIIVRNVATRHDESRFLLSIHRLILQWCRDSQGRYIFVVLSKMDSFIMSVPRVAWQKTFVNEIRL